MENGTLSAVAAVSQIPSPSAPPKRSASQAKVPSKPHRKRTKTENSQLPSNDIRCNYHRIIETIFNGCQKSIATEHFKSICADDCVLVSNSTHNPFGPNYRELRGIESMVEYVETALEAIPDCIFAITDSKFFRKAQNESMVIASYTVNGRMIYTIDALNGEDIEDIDSAISGLQMLYQGSCGDNNTEAEAAKLVCEKMESAVSKIELSSSKSGNGSSVSTDSLYSFINPPPPPATTAVPLPMSALADAASIAHAASSSKLSTVEPFDYSAKFTKTGRSLFESASAPPDEEESALAEQCIRSVAAAAEVAAGRLSPDAHTQTSTTDPGGGGSSSESVHSSEDGDNTMQRVASETALIDSAETTTSTINMALSDLNAASKGSFWLKQPSCGNVMIVKENAKFCLKEKIPPSRQEYKVKGTMTLLINSDKKVRRIELMHCFDTSKHI